jgi:hypothetical protein
MQSADSVVGLDALGARWRASGAPTDLLLLAERIPPGTDRARLITLLGQPDLVSPLANGGESWLYVKCDPAHNQFESLSVVLSPVGGFLQLDRKPVD